MNTKEVADALNGMGYGESPAGDIASAASEAGIVIVYGASDDLVELSGYVDDEVYGPGNVYFTQGGLLKNECEDDDCPYYRELKSRAAIVEAVWGEGPDAEYAWTYRTDIPHETFDVLEDGEKYCRGIVFYLHDAYKK